MLSLVSEVRAFDPPASRSPFASNKSSFRFDIVTPKRTYYIEAANPPSRSSWIEGWSPFVVFVVCGLFLNFVFFLSFPSSSFLDLIYP